VGSAGAEQVWQAVEETVAGGARGASLPRVPGRRLEAEATPAPGSVLLLHTDGLVERRDEPLDAGVRRPAGAVRTLAADDPDALCDGVLAAPGAERHDDDVAVPAVAVERA
jgi:hypothetical protein